MLSNRFLLSLALLGIPFAAFAPAAVASETGCTVILDASSGATLLRRGACAERISPASTFKVALALIGFDSGILKDAKTPALAYRPGVKAPQRDKKTVDPEIWLRGSVLWYSREITGQLGAKRFADYVLNLGYGNADVTGDAGMNNGLTLSWVDSSLKISPDEQVAFMRRIIDCSLPVSQNACALTKAAMPRFVAGDGWTVYGKTGAFIHRNDPQGLRTGWFVGWAEKDGRRIVFARERDQIGSKPQPPGLQVRADFLKELSSMRLPNSTDRGGPSR